MNLIALTPAVQRTLERDFSTGRWSPTTRAFFEALFVRVGGAVAPTIPELATQSDERFLSGDALGGDVLAQLTWLMTELAAVQQSVALVRDQAWQVAFAEVAPRTEPGAESGDLSPRSELGVIGLDLAPRVEPVGVDFLLGELP